VLDVVSLRLHLGAGGYREPGERVAFVERTLQRIAAMPGVESVGATNRLPAGEAFTEARLEVEGIAAEAGQEPVVAAQWVTPGYFDALAIPRLEGRGFTAGETRDAADVAIVSASLAQRLWPGASPLGRRLRPLGTEPGPWLDVIGTVGDIEPVESMVASARPARLHLYRPWSARPAADLTLVARAGSTAERVIDGMRDSVRQVDPGVVVDEAITMADAVDRDQWVSRIFSQLFGLYAAIAVTIALVGAYGLAADAVSRRTHELAVRMALGARSRQVVGLVMRQGLVLGAEGIVAGVLLALALTRFGSAMLPGVSARDPGVFSAVGILLAAVVVLASWLPARGVTRIEPAAALRSE
jgi:putative ABC transport system permease protein